MKKLLLPLACLCAISVHAATINGEIDVDELPSAKRSSNRYQRGAAEQPAAPPESMAVVYLLGDFPQAMWDNVPKTSELIQRGLQFEVSVMPVTKGAMVVFPNEDETFHNVFSYSPEKSFDLGRYRKGEEPGTVVFEEPGEIAVFCEIHRHMRSTILVLDTPVFTTAGTDGTFALENVPAGEYELVVWYGPGKTSHQQISVPADQETLTVQPAAPGE
ncbi:hypothetical protein [Cerasicoccus fimbriatus]|uniref:hypothetical protein n=1 Tax=Cerasicoccus fimbriatus TaxID=3014554 RepID=UPI0022B4C31B|nr:hypothetical protein [Cerasicoccus sp. TK19100]